MTDAGTWMTREEVQAIIDGMSADDLIEGMGDAGTVQGVKMVKDAFNLAAARMGYGDDATTRVRASDLTYLANQIGEAINVDSPLSEGTESLLGSVATGG